MDVAIADVLARQRSTGLGPRSPVSDGAQSQGQQYLRVADRTRELAAQLQREMAGLAAELEAADMHTPDLVLADLQQQVAALAAARSRVDELLQQLARDAAAQRAAAESQAQHLREERAALQSEVRDPGKNATGSDKAQILARCCVCSFEYSSLTGARIYRHFFRIVKFDRLRREQESQLQRERDQMAVLMALNGTVVRKCNSTGGVHDVFLRVSADKSMLVVRVPGLNCAFGRAHFVCAFAFAVRLRARVSHKVTVTQWRGLGESASRPERTLSLATVSKLLLGRVRRKPGQSLDPMNFVFTRPLDSVHVLQSTDVFRKQPPPVGDEADRSVSFLAAGRTLDVVFSSAEVLSIWLTAFKTLLPGSIPSKA